MTALRRHTDRKNVRARVCPRNTASRSKNVRSLADERPGAQHARPHPAPVCAVAKAGAVRRSGNDSFTGRAHSGQFVVTGRPTIA